MNNKPHILIVDDVAENIQVAMNILKEDNYDFSFACKGEEALSILNTNPKRFDLILLDIMMPGINGFDVCQEIKKHPLSSQIPLIFLTARVDVDSISRGFALGAVDYITKPFHADELLSRVRNHIKMYHAHLLLQEHNIALETKIKFEHRRLLTELEDNQKEMIYVLTELMEATSDETGKHIRRIADLSSLLALYHPALTQEDADILYHASPMHDIGKMTIPHEILNKPGRLNEQEFNIMQAHTTNAYQLLKNSNRKFLKAAAIIANEHHEKWDGSGYPRQLKGTEIHLYGRIVALADVFDALSHTRCYKSAWDMEDVLTLIRDQRGGHFDPELVDLFFDHLEEFKAIVEIK